MNGIELLTKIAQTNPADVQAIEAQCGGILGTIELLTHINAIQASLAMYPNDVAKGLDMVWKNNEQDIRYIFTDIGGLDGFLKIFPNLINILGTVEKHQKQPGV